MHRRHLLRSALIAGALLPAGTRFAPRALAQAATPCATTTPAEATDLARRALAALDARDLDLLDAVLAPEVIQHSPLVSDTVGLADFKASTQRLLDAFPDFRNRIEATVADGDMVALTFVSSGTNTGPFRGNPPTGRPVAWRVNRLVRVECGRIAEVWTFSDLRSLLVQLGLEEPTPAESIAPATLLPAIPVVGTPCPDPDSAAVASLLRAWFEIGWNSGDLSRLAPMLADGMSAAVAGGGDAMARIEERRAAMPDLAIDYGDILVEGNRAAAIWTARGTDTGGLMGHPPSGKEVAWSGISLIEARCGKIAKYWGTADTVGLMTQVGMRSPAEAAATPAP